MQQDSRWEEHDGRTTNAELQQLYADCQAYADAYAYLLQQHRRLKVWFSAKFLVVMGLVVVLVWGAVTLAPYFECECKQVSKKVNAIRARVDKELRQSSK